MKRHCLVLLVLLPLVPGPAAAQEGASRFFKVEQPVGDQLNRLGVSYRPVFNISGEFKNLGGFSQSRPGPATGRGIDRTYDDGYNGLDNSGNAFGLTTYWGYQSASQLDSGVPATATTLTLNSLSAAQLSDVAARADEPGHGAEINYLRQLGRLGRWRWGGELAISFNNFCLKNNGSLLADVTLISDVYTLGIVPPEPPYAGPRETGGFRPAIPDEPTSRSTSAIPGATITGRRELDADVVLLRLGPYLEFPFNDRVAVYLNGGLAVASVHGEFSFRESLAGANLGASGSASDSDWLVGGYLGANLIVAINTRLHVFAGVQYQNIGRYTQKIGAKKAVLNLSEAIAANFGIGFSF
jgi:opacity protein-like surface antigen